jgi:hypothetical protein
METIIALLLVIIVIILVYYLMLQQQQQQQINNIPIPSPNTVSNTISNRIPSTTLAASVDETAPLMMQPVEVLAPGYPLAEEYYYDPYYFYDPYWWWGGWYSGGYPRGRYHDQHHRTYSSGAITHGGIQPSGARMGGGGHSDHH